MRPLAAMFLGCCVLFSSPARGETTFPYKAVVTIDDVYVRSGPGQSYYPTDKLKRGQEVEVYRHDPGGWCAIRPVEGSFTWVSGRHLKLTDDQLAVVTEDGEPARVGSRLSRLRDVVQVRLRKGEVVEVLEAPHDVRPGTRRRGSRLPRPPASSAGSPQSISMPNLRGTTGTLNRCRRPASRPTPEPPGGSRSRPGSFRPSWNRSSWSCR